MCPSSGELLYQCDTSFVCVTLEKVDSLKSQKVTQTRCRIDTVNSPDDGHMAVRNTWRIEINIHERLCFKLVIYKDHTRMHGRQNMKL